MSRDDETTIPASQFAPQPKASDSLLPASTRDVLGGRYEILGLIGMGGMGAVYRARDAALAEIVALKMLRPIFATNQESLVQFRQEVRLARRVTHRNVARTYDFGEADGQRFLTMELVEGQTLAALIDTSQKIPIARTIEIALAICDGVAAAHDAGVVHRDLKPDNVAIAHDGRVVVMDFGIASGLGDLDLNSGGLVVGTAGYMSPEQAAGASDLDGRTDQYAIGTMIFEMLTGQLPFPGPAFTPILRRTLEPPPDPRNLRPDTPEPLAKITMRCLARSRDDRYADVHAVSMELRRLRSASTSSPPPRSAPRKILRALPTLAIFPLDVIDLPEQDHLGWGFADGAIDALSVVPGLVVYPRGVTSQMRASHSDLRSCGRLLGAEVIAYGTLRRSEEGFVAHVRLTTVEDGFQIWHRYIRDKDIERLVDAAARGISEAMGLSLPKIERVLRDPEVLDLFLRGRREHFRFTAESTARAQELLRLASERAPNDPVVLAAYASALGRQVGVDSERTVSLSFARDVAERAHAAAPHLPEPIVALASVLLQGGDSAGAAAHVARALALAPGSAEAHELAANLFFEAGALSDGHTHLDIAVHLEPRFVGVRYQSARAEALTGNWHYIERLVFGPVDPVSPFSYWADRFRLSLWRGNAEWIAGLDVAHLPGLTSEETKIAMGGAFVLREKKPSLEVRAMIDSMRASTKTTARAKTLVTQLQAEASGYVVGGGTTRDADDDRARCVRLISSAITTGIFDLPWLEKCPALACVRDAPEIREGRAVVAARAEAVLRALRTAP